MNLMSELFPAVRQLKNDGATCVLLSTVMPAYSDTLGERQKCHCKGGVTVTTCYYPGTKKTGLSVDDECVPIQIRSLIDDKCMPVQVKSFYG